MRKGSEIFTYLRATLYTRQTPAALANSQMGAWAASEMGLLYTYLHMSGVKNV